MDSGAAALANLLADATSGKQSVSLSVTTDEGMGRIYVNTGEIVHAIYGHLFGSEAVDAMLEATGVECEPLTPPLRASTPPLLPAADTLVIPLVERSTSAKTLPPAPILVRGKVVESNFPKARLRLLPVLAIVAAALVAGVSAGWAYTRVRPPLAGGSPASSDSGPPRDATPAFPRSAPVSSRPSVVVKLMVGPDGKPLDAQVQRSAFDPRAFEQAALSAARAVEFQPALRAGVPVAAAVELTVNFRVDGAAAEAVSNRH